MKRILVISYSQSGQLHRAVDATFKNAINRTDISLTYARLEPSSPFPFPWSYMQFWDAFAETVKGIPCEMKPVAVDTSVNYDLVIVAYQPWFLSPSRPVDSFLQSAQAKALLKDKPVVTLIACRNMWLNAQEKMKRRLHDAGARLVGNIAYVDRSGNLTSLVTVLAFALKGVQGKFLGIFPKYGVSDEELKNTAWKHGDIVIEHLLKNDYTGMQQRLVASGAVNIKPNLMMMEGRGKILFPLYADFILNKGKATPSQRKRRVQIFSILLPTLILILSPVITIVSRLLPVVARSKAKREIEYFSGTGLR